MATKEHARLEEARTGTAAWKKWGPYLSERQWGTVREDYSESGDAWNFFTHDHARSRAYRWGEDGIAGISDDKQRLCFSLALWNGKDPILKERLFGLTNSQGNHGEDVKEYYFYLDSTPTHSYMKYLYKYPQAAYPYGDLVQTNSQRSRHDMEYELLDTGVFNDNRYFDVFVEYAKGAADDILVKISASNRGPDAADLHLLPTLWFRNDWSRWIAASNRAAEKPRLEQIAGPAGTSTVAASHRLLGSLVLSCEGNVPLLFTENETNHERLFAGQKNESAHVKDGINDFVVHGREHAVNPEKQGTKVAAHYQVSVGAGKTVVIRLRLASSIREEKREPFGKAFDTLFDERRREADEFYQAVTPPSVSADAANVMRQAIAGMLWSKQFFFFDGDNWLDEHNSNPLHSGFRQTRNWEWFHMLNEDVISMPDKWEYPWYAAWDLAFHALPLSIADPDFAKSQMALMLRGQYLHPTGQMPAYEWNFSDVNPPVHAFATLFLHRTEQALRGEVDLEFLTATFNKLLLNFTWWVNRKDRFGKNVFEGGFLGLDNIGVFDRSAPLPTGGHLEQADGTAWMALFSQNMVELAVELAAHDPTYEDMVSKFVEHFYFIALGMNRSGADGMWDEEDGFYYDVLRLPDGQSTRLKVRSMVGLLPLAATTVIEKWQRERVPRVMAVIQERQRRMPELAATMHATGPGHFGVAERGLLALVNQDRLRRILSKMLDENEFLGPHGIRALSKFHERHPYTFNVHGQEHRVDYLPAESDSGMFGGNSNWRGPVWMPVNVILIRALLNYFTYYGDSFKVECPTGSGRMMNLFEVAKDIADRLAGIFLKDTSGRRPVYGGTKTFQEDPHWRDYLLFYEYFHGDNGAGLGASHQTGWTGAVASLIQLFGLLDAEKLLAAGKGGAFAVEPPAWAEMDTPRHPSLYQINTRVWLTALARSLGRPATLDDIPDAELDRLARMKFDWIWFLSVWQTGPAGQRVSRANPEWRHEFQDTLPDLREDDIAGSGFAITGYDVHDQLGGDAALARLRERLRARHLRLLLDFVPNHTGMDHPWVQAHPEYYVQGTDDDLARAPQNYTRLQGAPGDRVFAYGRDPYFAGWPDTLQLNYANPATQEAMIATLVKIAGQCDGVRCDMAMLVLPDVFERTWGLRTEPFWPRTIAHVREHAPGFCFMAEVYWDLEWTLQQQGFNYTYDKRLYDRLRDGHVRPIREHFHAGHDYQNKMARFLENHDEPRAAATFLPGAHEAAAVITFLAPGLRFFHQGQFEGCRKRISPHLVRGPVEPVDQPLHQFYDRLLTALKLPAVRDGAWQLLECKPAWEGNWTSDCFVAFAWQGSDGTRVVVTVNDAPNQSQCYVALPFGDLAGAEWRFADQIEGAVYDRDGGDLQNRGLYVDATPWQASVFTLTRSADQ